MDPGTRSDLDQLYEDLEAAVYAAGPICRVSGRCCRFREFGHTLFLSRLEAERLLEEGLPRGTVVSPDACPFQVNGLCTARERRPIGCRVYYCDAGYQDQGQALAEEFVNRIKRLHDRLGRDWEYRPLDHFLRELAGEGGTGPKLRQLPVLVELP